MLFDTHAHMDDSSFDADRHELLSSLPESGIALLMNPGCSLPCFRGTGYDGGQRTQLDFGSNLYVIEEEINHE